MALDHAMWEVAVRHNDPSPPPKPQRVSFPICEHEAGFRGWLKGLKFDLPAEFVEWLRQLQPSGTQGSGLARLAELNNTDKHRVLPVIALSEPSASLGLDARPRDAKWSYVRAFAEQPLRTGSEMVRLRFDRPMEHVELHPESHLEPALPQHEGEAMPETLSQRLTVTHQLVWRTLHQLPDRYLRSC